MRFIHTFWSKPMLNSKFGIRENHLRAILTDYSYSVHCVRSHNEKIVLYTDKFGADLLSFLPYDEVIILDNLDDESIHFAAQVKIEALKRCDLGDVIIDGDLFLVKKKSIDLIKEKQLNNDIIYSFFETHNITCAGDMKYYYLKLLQLLKKTNIYNPPYILPNKWSEMNWFNTSLISFTNQKLKNEYIEQYDFHKNSLKNIDFEDTWPDIIVEQYFLTLLVKNKYKSEPVIKDYSKSHQASKYMNYVGFTHLGFLKQLLNSKYEKILNDKNPKLYRLMNAQYDSYVKLLKQFII